MLSKQNVKVLGVFSLTMISVAAVLSLRNFPTMATYGWSSIGWYLIGTLLFFLPLSLVAAELATAWPKNGGIFAWVKEAFDTKRGFLAVWCDWAENLVWFPTLLAFISATIAYALFPGLAQNNVFFFIVMVTLMWGVTFFNYFGTKLSSVLSSFGVIAGSLFPAALLIILAAAFVIGGHSIAIPFTPEALIPDLTVQNLPFLATVLVLFAGMELAGFHALETKNPQRTYSLAMLWAALIIFTFSVVATLAIAIVVPANQISLDAGLMQAFQQFFDKLGVSWLIAPIGLLIAFGAIAQFSTWLLGPAKGLHAVVKAGSLPQALLKQNKQGIPTRIMVLQALIGSAFMLVFLFVPAINTSYWMLTAVTAQILAIMYMLLFAAAIKLRYAQPGTKRPFKIPGGKFGIWVVGGAGLFSSIFTFIVGFVPPSNMSVGQAWLYPLGIAVGVAVLTLPPLIFHRIHHKTDERRDLPS